MLTDRQIERILSKLKKFEEKLSSLIFVKEDEVRPVRMYRTNDQLDRIPEDELFADCPPGSGWGGESGYCWFKGSYEVPARLAGKALYLYPRAEGYEAALFVDGRAFGTFCTKIVITGHGNHYCNMIRLNPGEGEKIDLALEYYAGHYVIGCDPWKEEERRDYNYTFQSLDICSKDQSISDFYFDLKTLNQMAGCLDQNSFRRSDIINSLCKVHEVLYYSREDVREEVFRESIRKAAAILKGQFEKHNSVSAPWAGLIGHSHMDTAWLWAKGETIKKCARTYSNELNLMEQYTEYKFIQSSAYHSRMIKTHYPELFERIREKVKEGRYEPNGGVYIECDCNITSGESIIRQFLWGQRFTRKEFDYTANCFWLPDTFGYSASIPQILKGCGVDYFLTTKMGWNDTTVFPYDTFIWKGIDGTRVLTHFNKSHTWPDAETVLSGVQTGEDSIREKTVSRAKLISYGFGDGGGGPQFEMIEMARRIQDMEGIPRTEHMLAGDFMRRLDREITDPSVHMGELYLELHRGTLTNQHTIKRNNRMAERHLHDLEFLSVFDGIRKGEAADGKNIAPFMETLLVNQFHDILPGTCIPAAHEESIAETTALIRGAREAALHLLRENALPDTCDMRTVVNPSPFARNDVIYFEDAEGMIVKGGYIQQRVTGMHGEKLLAVAGITIPPYASAILEFIKGEADQGSSFTRNGNVLDTPGARVIFHKNGYLESYYDKEAYRELRGEGYALNTFLVAEDMPEYWDNWDLDADTEMKFRDQAELISSEVISDGMVEYRIRNCYRITEKSSITQIMIFHAGSADVRFETVMDWQDHHRFLKTAFDVSVFSDMVRQEIQFGYLKRATSRNTAAEKAKFEVCNHKYTDFSENRYGISILNDCKYGISVKDSQMRLSLHKGGRRPDYKGDLGIHECVYTFHPHNSGFSAEAVIHPAYEMNYPVIQIKGAVRMEPMISVDQGNVVIETIKPCEETQKAFIVRIYEAEGTYTNATLSLPENTIKVFLTNMLEDIIQEWPDRKVTLKPFEIKTFMVLYS